MNGPMLYIISITASIIGAALAFAIWFAQGRNRQTNTEQRDHLPEWMNSMDVGLIYNGRSDALDVVALVFELANDGYLRLTPLDMEWNTFKITKLKTYDGDSRVVRQLMNELFPGNSNMVRIDKYRSDIGEIFARVAKTEQRASFANKVSTKHPAFYSTFQLIASLSMIITLFCISYNAFRDYRTTFVALPIFAMFIFPPMQIIIDSTTREQLSPFKMVSNVLRALPILIFIILSLYIITPPDAKAYAIVALLAAVMSLTVIIILGNMMPERTKEGNNLYAEVAGYRNYLNSICSSAKSVDSLKFFNVFPNTFVLSIHKELFAKFEDITVTKPSWLVMDETFTVKKFSTYLSNLTATVAATLPRPASLTDDSSGSWRIE